MVSDLTGVPCDYGYMDFPADWTVPRTGWALHVSQHIMLHVPRPAQPIPAPKTPEAIPSKARSEANIKKRDEQREAEEEAAVARLQKHTEKILQETAPEFRGRKFLPSTSKAIAPKTAPQTPPPKDKSEENSQVPNKTPVPPGAAPTFWQLHNMPPPPPPPKAKKQKVEVIFDSFEDERAVYERAEEANESTATASSA